MFVTSSRTSFPSKNKSKDSFSSSRVTKPSSKKAGSFREKPGSFKEFKSKKYVYSRAPPSYTKEPPSYAKEPPLAYNISSPQTSPNLNSAIVTIVVGPTQRLFASHEDTLHKSPLLSGLCHGTFFHTNKRITLPYEEPEIFSAVLEFLYKGDYYPRIAFDKKRQSWVLETQLDNASDAASISDARSVHSTAHYRRGSVASTATTATAVESVVHYTPSGDAVLKDTIIYCAATRYGLPELKRLALKKQGLQAGVNCGTVLSSARYAYENTAEEDSRLRAHYLALIIRSRGTFKRSGSMQMEMERGGKVFFDLFVALCNHVDDLSGGRS